MHLYSEQRRMSVRSIVSFDLPGLSVGSDEGGIVHSCAHHCGHAWCSVEQIKEGLLCDMVQVHYWFGVPTIAKEW
jgi:hypothetical protein